MSMSSRTRPHSTGSHNSTSTTQTQTAMLAAAVLDNPEKGTVSMRKSLGLLMSDMECTLCNEVFRNPSTSSACGHTFCEACIQHYSKNNYKCPMPSCEMSVTCKGTSKGAFTVHNPSVGSAVESWTALLQTLAAAKPVWWNNADISSDYTCSTGTATGISDVDVAGVPVPAAATATFGSEDEGEDNGPTVDLQAMEHAPSPGGGSTTQDETVYGTAESRPPSDDDDDDDMVDDRDDGL